jgi:hypothetical protein
LRTFAYIQDQARLGQDRTELQLGKEVRPMLKLTSRAALAVLLLLMAINGLVIFTPRDASAACAYDISFVVRYYSEPELINEIGECYRPCWRPITCTGATSEYYDSIDYTHWCTPICE